MKRNSKFIMLGVIALTGVTAFTSCSSDESAPVNPTFDGESVKTQFTIAFPSNVAETRMSAATVQNDPDIANFRGIDQIVLYPFLKTGAVDTDPIASTDTKLGAAIELTTMVKPSSATVSNSIPAQKLLAASNAVLYNDVTIPVGTGSFLFYGKAIDNGTDKFVNGSLTMTGNEPADIAFALDQIYPTSTTASTVGANLATYLSGIAQATNWAGCADAANYTQSWYSAALGDLYTNFIALKAGSSLDVQAAVQDLYSSIWKNTDAVSTAIKGKILDATYASDAGGATNPNGTLTFTAAVGNTDATYFPGDVNLPDGAALLKYTASTKTFEQVTDGTGNLYNGGVATPADLTAKYTDYVYPASLYYYANSGVKTANSSKESEYNGSQNWSTIYGKYTDGTSVVSTTRSVAILDAIQYAVGRLDATVKTADNTLYDRIGDAYDATAGFTVTGILIGGQKPVGFDFTPNTAGTEVTIYDNITKSYAGTTLTANTTASAPNYTLALETAKDQHVFVAVELLNNGADFQGFDGVVPAGCKFYLVAELNPEDGNTTTAADQANTGNKVFKQDFKTIANFTIRQGNAADPATYPAVVNNNGLGAAYNTIPDLRAPQLELGLSVDLTWKTGITFTQTF